MFLNDLINHTCAVLPLFSDKFTDNKSISSISKSSNTVTATSTAHGLAINDVVTISGVKTTVVISSITRSDNIATATCATEHGVTVGYPMPKTNNIEIESATPEYNGMFEVLTAPTLTTFTFKVTGTPASGTGTLQTFFNLGFNGTQTITAVPTVDTFEYQLQNDALLTGDGTDMEARASIRISGAADIERIKQSYTEQNLDVLWGFFTLEPVSVSNDRSINNDSVNQRLAFDDIKTMLINDVSFYVIIPSDEEISGRVSMDLAQELLGPIYKTLVGFLPETPFNTSQESILMPTGHSLDEYNGAFLVYKYDFQVQHYILRNGESEDETVFMANTGDVLPNFGTSAFKRFDGMYDNEFDETIKDDEYVVQN